MRAPLPATSLIDSAMALSIGRAFAGVIVAAVALSAGLCGSGVAGAAPVPLDGPVLYGSNGWEVVPLPFADSKDLHIACLSAKKCLASGDSPDSNAAVFLKTTNGGVSWSTDGSSPSVIADLSCVPDGFCLAVSYNGASDLVASASLGAPWQPIAAPPLAPSSLKPVSATCVRAFCIVTGADSGGNVPTRAAAAFLTRDRGKTWRAVRLPPSLKDVQSLACMPNGTCYLVYDTYTRQFSDMAVSTNKGRSWTPVHRAAGFTSLGGFSCPSSSGCVYLATQVLEVSSGDVPSWSGDYGPFSHKQVGAIGTWALACTSTSQCMIGGDISSVGAAQEVVWIHAPAWSDKQVTQRLKTAIFQTSSSFTNAAVTLSHATGGPGLLDAYSALENAVQENMATIAGIALHTQGHRQRELGAIDAAWGALHHSLLKLANSKQPSAAADESTLISDLKAIVRAEQNAGVDSNLTLPTGVPV